MALLTPAETRCDRGGLCVLFVPPSCRRHLRWCIYPASPRSQSGSACWYRGRVARRLDYVACSSRSFPSNVYRRLHGTRRSDGWRRRCGWSRSSRCRGRVDSSWRTRTLTGGAILRVTEPTTVDRISFVFRLSQVSNVEHRFGFVQGPTPAARMYSSSFSASARANASSLMAASISNSSTAGSSAWMASNSAASASGS